MVNTRQNLALTSAIVLLAAIALTFPIYYFGMPSGNDLPQHFRFIQTFYNAVSSGDLYPAWASNTNLGFGDAGIRFYPPLAYYAVALFRSFTESWTTALALTICFWFFIGGLGVYLLARESFSEKASVVAALVFMAMPYHVNQVYNAGLFAEFAGLAILPFCFLLVRRTILLGRIVDFAGLSIFYSMLILAHLPLAMIGSIGLLVYTTAMLGRARSGLALLKLSASVAMALVASSFYWVRMVSELSLVSHTLPKFTDRFYDFQQNFLASVLYLPASQYGETSAWFTDLLFAITLAMVIPAFTVFWLSAKTRKREVLPLVAVLITALFLSTPLSVWLWEHVDLLAKIQFPWRFLGLMSLAGSVLIAGCVDQLSSVFQTKLRPLGLIVVGLLVAGMVFTFSQVIRPASFSSREEFDKNFETFRDDRSFECWWPVGADERAFTNRAAATSQHRSIDVSAWADNKPEFAVGRGEQEQIRVAKFYYPYWRATANGVETPISPADDGTMLIAVPPGEATIKLFFARPAHEVYSQYASMVAWILLVLAFIAHFATRPRLN